MPRLVNLSIVAVAQPGFPPLLEPSRLVQQGVVPNDWTFSQQPVVTPMFSALMYANGLALTANGSNITIGDNNPPDPPTNSQIARIAESLIGLTAGIRYTALGVNFNRFRPDPTAAEYLLNEFIQPGRAAYEGQSPIGIVVAFRYQRTNAILQATAQSGEVQLVGKPTSEKGLLVGANYHVDLGKSDPAAAAARVSPVFGDCLRDFEHFTQTLFAF